MSLDKLLQVFEAEGGVPILIGKKYYHAPGSTTRDFKSLSIDLAREKELIDTSFNKTLDHDQFKIDLKPEYFDEVHPTTVYHLETESGDYVATIVAREVPTELLPDKDKPIVYLNTIAVAPQYQGKRLFSKIFDMAVADLKKMYGDTRVFWRCAVTNTCAIEKYDKMVEKSDKVHSELSVGTNPPWKRYSIGLDAVERSVMYAFADEQKRYWNYRPAATNPASPQFPPISVYAGTLPAILTKAGSQIAPTP